MLTVSIAYYARMYTKLFHSILDSSVWSHDSDTRIVWITLLAMQDKDGYIFGAIDGIARRAVLPIEVVESAMNIFLSPDPRSSDLNAHPEHEGRRIEVAQRGWRLLNSAYYRDLKSSEDRRQQNREAQARFRNKRRVSESNQGSEKVSLLDVEEAKDGEQEALGNGNGKMVRASHDLFYKEKLALLKHNGLKGPKLYAVAKRDEVTIDVINEVVASIRRSMDAEDADIGNPQGVLVHRLMQWPDRK